MVIWFPSPKRFRKFVRLADLTSLEGNTFWKHHWSHHSVAMYSWEGENMKVHEWNKINIRKHWYCTPKRNGYTHSHTHKYLYCIYVYMHAYIIHLCIYIYTHIICTYIYIFVVPVPNGYLFRIDGGPSTPWIWNTFLTTRYCKAWKAWQFCLGKRFGGEHFGSSDSRG